MNNQGNVRLCRAVQQHSCIYDHAVAHTCTREAFDRAWLEVAKTCEESVGICKQRWRTIRTNFARSLVGSPKKRKGNRAREHNLQDVLEFLIPHLNDRADALPFRESDDEAEGVAKVVTNNSEADDGFLEEPVIKREIEELKEDNKNEVEIKVGEEPNTDDDKADTSSKRPPSARLKEVRKTSVDIKVSETRAGRKTQSLENTVNAEEDLQNMFEDRLSKNAQISKSKVGTFYISATNSDIGTLHIKKNNDDNELAVTTENEANMTNDESVLYECELNESTQPESKVEDPIKTRQYRLKRACKRGLGKKTMTRRDLRQKETAAKGVRRNATRLKTLGEATKQLLADTKLTMKTGNASPVETQTTRTRTLCIPQGDTIKVGLPQKKSLRPVIKLTRYDANSSKANVDQGIQCSLQPTTSDDDFFDTLKPYLSKMNARQKLHFKKKIFESLMEVFDSTSDFPENDKSKAIIPKELSAVSGDELHLVRELVAMVQAAKHTPELNLDLSSGSGGDLANKTSAEKCAVISPTVASRVTPKQPTSTPPLSLRVSPFNTTTTGNPLSTSTMSSNRSTSTNVLSSGAATSTQTATTTPSAPLQHRPTTTSSAPLQHRPTTTPSAPLLHRRVIHKLVKVNELGTSSASNMPSTSSAYARSNNEILHRRIYRIYPKSGVNNASLENTVNASSVGTFIVPRSTAETTVHKTTTSSQLASTSTSARTSGTATNQKVTPVSGTSAPLLGLVGSIVKNARNPTTVRVGARPLVRRYSVCGDLQNFETASNNYLTTTANAKEPVSSTPKITIAHRCSPANVAGRDVFRLPTPFRSAITSVNAITSPVATNTTTSRTTPVASVSAGSDRNSAGRTIPFNMGFNKSMRNDERTTMTSPPRCSSNAKACRDSNSSSSHVVGNKRSLATYAEVVAKRTRNDERTTMASPPRCSSNAIACCDSSCSSHVVGYKRSPATYADVVGKRNNSFTEEHNEEEAVGEDVANMSVIASDEFDILNIKAEPADDIN